MHHIENCIPRVFYFHTNAHLQSGHTRYRHTHLCSHAQRLAFRAQTPSKISLARLFDQVRHRLYELDCSILNTKVCDPVLTMWHVCRTVGRQHHAYKFKIFTHHSLLLAEIKPRIWKCMPGWNGTWCDEKCAKLGRGKFYSVATQQKGNCAVATCKNKLKPGQYYSDSAAPGETSCPVGSCTNAKNGEYYTGSAPAGGDTCPVASCTTKLKAGQYFTTNGGTSPIGCKIGQGGDPD